MDIFISWSGPRSKAVAEILRGWIKRVLQQTEPWYSEEMDRGAGWFQEIRKKLESSKIAIVCLTKENQEKP